MAKIRTLPAIDRYCFDYRVFKLSIRRQVTPNELKCFEALERLGQASSNQVSELLIIPRYAVSARLSDLKRRGFIVKITDQSSQKITWKINYPLLTIHC